MLTKCIFNGQGDAANKAFYFYINLYRMDTEVQLIRPLKFTQTVSGYLKT